MPSQSASRRARNERIAAIQKQQQAEERRRQILWWTVGLVVVGALVALIAVSVIHKNKSNTTDATPGPVPTLEINSAATKLTTGQPLATSAPSGNPLTWPLPSDPGPYVTAAGLTTQAEMTNIHYHAHLDVIDNGKNVALPQGLGFVTTTLSFVHTHDTSGIIHLESPTAQKFTLGQAFVEWGVRLTSTCVGGLCTDSTHDLKFFVNGKQYTKNPQDLVFKPHMEVAIWYGAKGAKVDVPSSYKFPAGD